MQEYRPPFSRLQTRSAQAGCLLPVTLLLLAVSFHFVAPAAADGPEPAEIIRNLVDRRQSSNKLVCHGEMVCGLLFIPEFYANRGYRPAWGLERKQYANADALMAIIRQAYTDGLNPSDYHLTSLEFLLKVIKASNQGQGVPPPFLVADADLLLTDAFLLYGSHILAGRVNPETIHPDWNAFRQNADMSALLAKALETGTVDKTLVELRPPHRGYDQLKRALAAFRADSEKGEWPRVQPGPTLRLDDRGPRVKALRLRLAAEDPRLAETTEEPEHFGLELELAVMRFQERHGLTVDGLVGSKTLASLNVSRTDRIRQMEINLERWRWIPRDLGRHYILVNIADFSLIMVEEGRMDLHMRVVVGKPYRKTPVFSSEMTYLVINPYWNVPRKLAVQDIIPKVRRNPDYLREQGIRILSGWEENATEIDPLTVDWRQLNRNNFPYRLRQDPGPLNALGSIKFMFPNKHAVYLHDTPKRDLFQRSFRGFSSGCIRVEKPVALADHLLKNAKEWSPLRIREVLGSGETLTVPLPEPVPIHLLYWTAWVDAAGVVQFREDIYDRDRALDTALHRRVTP